MKDENLKTGGGRGPVNTPISPIRLIRPISICPAHTRSPCQGHGTVPRNVGIMEECVPLPVYPMWGSLW